MTKIEVARTLAQRTRGLHGRHGVETGHVLSPGSSVHTLGMRFAIDVAYVAADGRALAVRAMRLHRVGLPRPRSKWLLETESGRMPAWGIRPGRRLRLG